ncbi:MAG: MoxR family ATPase [Alphaproteobacteria bacterium]|nr:MoxR family ATPase [Alphaproteobacteria bacterium]
MRLVGASADTLAALRQAVAGALRGKDDVVDLALTCVLASGHLLLQDVPGVGKTTLASALARALGGSFSRVQFTSDLLPSDITGNNVLEPGGGFAFRPGPLFANVVLADEINRTTPKTQSALFEAMEERQVTVDGCSRDLPAPFVVIATQNPFDFHGTYHLPESQLDRFLMRLAIGYPDRGTERELLRAGGERRTVEPLVSSEDVTGLIREAAAVSVPELVEEYLLDLVRGTRTDARFVRGVSTRGAQALHRAVRARALVEGRRVAIPEDVRALAVPVLAHRVLARSGSAQGGDVEAVASLLDELPPPL